MWGATAGTTASRLVCSLWLEIYSVSPHPSSPDTSSPTWRDLPELSSSRAFCCSPGRPLLRPEQDNQLNSPSVRPLKETPSNSSESLSMDKLKFAAVSRNYFNMPIWVAKHAGHFSDEGLDVDIELHEPIDEVTDRLRDGRVQFAFGVTEHVILDNEAGGNLGIIGGNVNRLPFSFISKKGIRTIADLRGKTVGVSSIEAGSSSLGMKILAAHGLEYPRDYNTRAVGAILAPL